MIVPTFLQDHDGKTSSMRLISVASFVMAAFLAITAAFGYADASNDVVMWFLLAGTGPKAVQSFAGK